MDVAEGEGYQFGTPPSTPPPRTFVNPDQTSVWEWATDCPPATGSEAKQRLGTLDCGRFCVNFVMDLLGSRGPRMKVNEHGKLTSQADLIFWLRTNGSDVPAFTNTTYTRFSAIEENVYREDFADDTELYFRGRSPPDNPQALENFLAQASAAQPIIMSITDTGPSNIEGHWVVVCGSRLNPVPTQELWVYDPLKGKTCWIRWEDFRTKLWPFMHDGWNCPEKAINVFP